MKFMLSSSIVAFALLMFSCNIEDKKIDGGYDFVDIIPDIDTNLYSYPIKDKKTGRDSVWQSFSHFNFEAFDEPNISLYKAKEPIFRFEYETAFNFPHVIITLVNQRLIIKTAINGISSKKILDDSLTKLNEIEKLHFKLLRSKYPLEKYIKNYANWHPKKKHYYDSIIKASPEILSPQYFKNLTEKALIDNPTKFSYSKKEISLSKKEFSDLVDSINASGYWHLPFNLPRVSRGADGYAFTLEANAYGKYNIVSGTCWETVIVPYMKSLQQIINKSNLSKDINVYRTEKERIEKLEPIIIQDMILEDFATPKKDKKKKK